MIDTVLTYARLGIPLALTVLGAVAVVLAAIAPLTRTDFDNRVLAWVQKGIRALEWILSKTPIAGRIARPRQ